MADYTNAKDLQNNKDYGLGTQLNQASKLADMLQKKSAQSQQSDQFQSSQAQKNDQFNAQLSQQREMPGIQQEATQKEYQFKTDTDQGVQKQNFDTAQQFVDENAKKGRKLNVKLGNVDISQTDQNLYLQNQKASDQEGKILYDRATKLYKPVDDQAQAVKTTIDSLNLGTPAGDSAAVMNELKAVTGSSRGVATLFDKVGGHPTAATTMAEMINYITNAANSTMQPAQRNGMREFAYSRIGQLRQQHDSITGTLNTTAPSFAHTLASSGQLPGLINSYGAAPRQALDDLDKLQKEYTTQKGNTKVSNNSTFSPQPTTLDSISDKLSNFFRPSAKSPQPSSPQAAPAQGGAPMSFEEFKAKKAAGQL